MENNEDLMDEDGYPTEQCLEMIKKWPVNGNPHEDKKLMDFIRPLWNWDKDFFVEEKKEDGIWYTLITGGWSGNESLIGALQDNNIFRLLYWELSERGGLFKFKIKA